jgi:beta-catenin-like protein 1
MTSIDDLFKSHNGTKRKFENPIEADPSQAYKSVKLQDNSDVKRSAQVEDEEDDDEAGPALPPDFEDEEPGDDEEGRFFGGGLDENAKDAMDFLDAQDGEDAIREEKYDAAWVRKLARDFERKVHKNASLRAKYENDPTKFMESEGDLDDGTKDLSILSEHAELYEEFAKSTAAAKLVELLAHENTDIAIGAIEIISELTDEDVAAEQEQWDALVAAFLEADLLSLLISNFSRFDETDATDASGVYHSLSVIENLLSQPSNTDTIGKEKALLTWLLERIQRPEKPTTQNKQYASEILSILTQSSRPNRALVAEANGVEILLTNLAPYRRDDPEKDSDEEEYMENLFNILTSIVEEPIGKTKFLEAEGTELCLLLVRDGKTSKNRAFKVLDHACSYAETPSTDGSIPPHIAVCEKLIEARGLKLLFSTFMKTKRPDPAQTEHILALFTSLLRSLPGNSDARMRLLAKFLENSYAKIDKLLALRRDYAARLAAFDRSQAARTQGLSAQDREEQELDIIPQRLSEGLYALQCIDATLAWLVAEDDGAKKAIVAGLVDADETLASVKATLKAQLDGVLEVEAAEREVLEALAGFLN